MELPGGRGRREGAVVWGMSYVCYFEKTKSIHLNMGKCTYKKKIWVSVRSKIF